MRRRTLRPSLLNAVAAPLMLVAAGLIAWSMPSHIFNAVAAEPAATTVVDRWPSFRQNLTQSGVATGSLPNELVPLWELATGDLVQASAAIVDGKAFIPSLSGELRCVDLNTGNIVWTYRTVEEAPANSFRPGFKAAPTVAAGSVLVGDEDGIFHSIDAVTGKRRWTYETGQEIFSAAAVVDGKVLFGSYDNSLHCLKLDDGSPVWKFATEGYVHCAPAVVNGLAFIAGCDEHLRGIDVATGAERFKLKINSYLIASPAIHGDFLYVGTYGSEVLAVNWKTQEIAWRYRDESKEFPYHSSAAVTDRLVIVGGRDKLIHAIDRAKGTRVWSFATRGRVDSSPVVVGDRVFVGSSDGNLYALAMADGKELWKHNFGGKAAITAGPAVAEGRLIVGCESRDGRVICFGAKR